VVFDQIPERGRRPFGLLYTYKKKLGRKGGKGFGTGGGAAKAGGPSAPRTPGKGGAGLC